MQNKLNNFAIRTNSLLNKWSLFKFVQNKNQFTGGKNFKLTLKFVIWFDRMHMIRTIIEFSNYINDFFRIIDNRN